MNIKSKVIALMLLPVLLLAGCKKEEPAEKSVVRPVKAMQVGGVEVLIGRTFPGQAKASQEVNLAFRIAGTLTERPVDVGTEVKEGDLVARLDPRDYQVELDNAQGQLAKARAGLTLAKSDYERVTRIYDKDPGAISEAMIDAKKGEMDSARAQVRSLGAAVNAAKDNLSYTYLHAPFAGTVTMTFVENFEDVQAKQQIARIVDTKKIEFMVSIPESLISYAPQVKKVWVRFDTFPDREIPATIKEIGKEPSRTTRTYPVTLIMDQPEDIKILPGMAGKSVADKEFYEALEGYPDQGYEIPVTAAFSDEEDKTYVWIIDEETKTVSRREVQTGQLSDTGILITEGLEPGEWIATAGVHTLREGQQVKIIQ
jgi:RND family efflux transporter MFP subunit